MPHELNLWFFENQCCEKGNSSVACGLHMAIGSGGKFLKFIAKNSCCFSVCVCFCDGVCVPVCLWVSLCDSVCVCLWVHPCDCVCVHLKRSSGKWWLLGGGTSVAILMVTTVSTSIPPSFASPKSTLVSSIFESKFNEIKVSDFRGEIHTDYWCWYWYCIPVLVRT